MDELAWRKHCVKLARKHARKNGCTCQSPYPKYVQLIRSMDRDAVDLRHESSCPYPARMKAAQEIVL